jgi:hypothetical protein
LKISQPHSVNSLPLNCPVWRRLAIKAAPQECSKLSIYTSDDLDAASEKLDDKAKEVLLRDGVYVVDGSEDTSSVFQPKDAIGLMALQVGKKLVGVPEVVGVEEGDQRGAAGGNAAVASDRNASVGLPHQTNPMVRLGQFGDEAGARIGRAVIDSDQFPVAESLLLNGAEGCQQMGSRVENWHHH